MGGKGSKFVEAKVTGGRKKVVIVGGSFGGKMITQHLQAMDPKEEQFEILIVDKSHHFEFICSNYKALCEEGTFQKHSVDFKTAMKGFNSQRVNFQQGMLKNVMPEQNQIEVEDSTGTKSMINYDCLVIVTGASYLSPWRGETSEYQSLQQRDDEMKAFREKLKASKSILCVGAGATGLESACYIKETWPDKKIGVCQRGNTMIPDLPGAHDLIDGVLKRLGVQYHPGTSYSAEGGGVADEYEAHVDCRGFSFDGPNRFLKDNMSDCVDSKTGQIWVNQFCNVTNKHPIASNHEPKALKIHSNIFSFGDVCLTPSNEIKSIVSQYQYVNQVAWNIQQTLAGGSSQKPIPDGSSFHNLCFVPLGKTTGIQVMNGKCSEDKGVPVEKDKIMELTMGFLNGDKKAIKEEKDKIEFFPKLFGFLEGCCTCIPPHINKVKAKNQEKFDKSKAMFEKMY